MAEKIQLLAIILAISISVGYARSAKKIIKGQAAWIGEFPHQVSLQTEDGQHFCGGSIISSTLIITAAHCIVDENRNSREDDICVIVGTNDRDMRTPDNVFRVVRRIYHNKFIPNDSLPNDIAILKLERPIKFNNLVRPAKLPFTDVPPGTSVMSSGWGVTTWDNVARKGGNASGYLQKIERTIVSQQQCREKTARTRVRIGPGHICVQSQNGAGGAGTCRGDSGGPLTYNGQVIGLTSLSIGGCARNFPEIYTSIHHYLPWIRTAEWYMANNAKLPSNTQDFVEV